MAVKVVLVLLNGATGVPDQPQKNRTNKLSIMEAKRWNQKSNLDMCCCNVEIFTVTLFVAYLISNVVCLNVPILWYWFVWWGNRRVTVPLSKNYFIFSNIVPLISTIILLYITIRPHTHFYTKWLIQTSPNWNCYYHKVKLDGTEEFYSMSYLFYLYYFIKGMDATPPLQYFPIYTTTV